MDRIPRCTGTVGREGGSGSRCGVAFSPVDLIPDFAPVLGQLDDLLIALGIRLTIHLIPNKLMEEFRAELFDGNSG